VEKIVKETEVPSIKIKVKELENGSFEKGKRGWEISSTDLMKTAVVTGNAFSGDRALYFKARSDNGFKRFSYSQEVEWERGRKVILSYYLVTYSKFANASLMIEAFDGRGNKKAQLVYFFGGKNWDYGNVGPDKTKGFYAIKKRGNSAPGRWHLLIADPEKDLDAVHGEGTWERLKIKRLRINLRGWALERDNNILEGYMDDVRYTTSVPYLR